MSELTAEQAIDRSITHDEIVTIPETAAALAVLRGECDECAEGVGVDGDTNEYWGDEEGQAWRVHTRR